MDSYFAFILNEQQKREGQPLYEWIVIQAKKQQLAGATVLRGMEGFGQGNTIHTTHVLRLSDDLPVVVEIVDTQEKIESFLELLGDVPLKGLVTQEKVKMSFHRPDKQTDAESQ